jgi:hypothetical protein
MYTLITCANSAKAYALKNNLPGEQVIMGDFEALPEFLVNSGKMIRLPNPVEPSYIHQVLALCLDQNINKICPLRAQEQVLLLNSAQLFAEYGISILVDDQIQ